jgi:hypothetical protein
MLQFLYIAGSINCVVYVASASAYANARTQAFEDLVPGALMLLTAFLGIVLTIVSGVWTFARRRELRRLWVALLATLICAGPVLLLALHAANRAAHTPSGYGYHSTPPNEIAGLNRILRLGFAVGFLCAQDFSAGESAHVRPHETRDHSYPSHAVLGPHRII